MNLLETYSHNAGVQPEKPSIDEVFYPIEHDKYVVIQASSGMPSKTYDLWDEVIEHIKLPTIQVGGKDDPLLPVTLPFRGLTTWNHTAFIIKNSSLFLGNDSVGNHMASYFGVPRIALFGATSPLTCGGAWNKHNGIELVPSDMRGCAAPCHNSNCIRDVKCINTISAKTVLTKISELLGKESVTIVDILHAGPLTKQVVLEWVPFNLNQQVFNTLSVLQGTVSLRADLYEPNLAELSNFCNQTNLKYVVIIKPENLNSFFIHPSKVDRLMLLVDKTNIKQSLAKLRELSNKLYKVGLISYLGHEEFNDYKLEMLDYPPIIKLNDFDVKEEHVSKFANKTFNIKSFRKIVGKDGKFFLTLKDAQDDKNNVEISRNNCNINITTEHLKELHFLTIREYA